MIGESALLEMPQKISR